MGRAETLNSLGTLKMKNKLYVDAEAQFKQMVDLRERKLKPNHPDLAQGYMSLGTLHGRTQCTAPTPCTFPRCTAEPVHRLARRHAAAGAHSLPPPPVPPVRYCLLLCVATGTLLQELARFDESLGYLQKALSVYTTAYNPNHPKVRTYLLTT